MLFLICPSLFTQMMFRNRKGGRPMTRFRYLKFATVLIAVLLLAIISVIAVSIRRQTANADALWKIVHGRCVPDMKTKHNPAPCVSVNLAQGEAGGFAILKDAKGNTQYLVIPTAKITGIESPAILAPNAINYFSEAWAVTDLVDQRLNHTLPRTDFAIAINSVSGRSQNQLHIHVDCIQPRAKSELEQLGPEIRTTWQTLPVNLLGREYRAMWLPGTQLGQRNPFHLLASSLSDPTQAMGGHTLVLVGAERDGQAGFFLLDGKAPAFAIALSPWVKLGFGSGEELEDHGCQLANGAS
jgi:CDP-diacylglycerol pyrophosphatase